MKRSIDDEAATIIAEMEALGATFDVTRSGPSGELRWHHDCAPGARDTLRRFKADVDLTKPGLEQAICRQIMRAKFVGAP